MEKLDSLLIFDTTYNRLMDEAVHALGNTQITNKGPGGVARLLLGIVNKQISNFYTTLKREHAQVFLSQATGTNVDKIGELLACVRKEGETDDAYKFRITNQVLTMERANETSIRLAALSVEGVKDVIMKPFTHGAGSFSVYPILNNAYDPSYDEILRTVGEKVAAVRAFGVKAVVLQPNLSFVELKGRISFGRNMSDMDRLLIQDRVTQSVRRHINSLLPGDLLRINQLHRLVMDEDASVADVEFYHFVIDGRARLLVDQEPAWNARYLEANGSSAIAFS